MILSQIFEKLVAFIQNVLITPVADMLENTYDSITDFALQARPPQNVLDFSGAMIRTFIPVEQIGVALSIIIPAMVINLVIAVILRVKSFIPSMGGK